MAEVAARREEGKTRQCGSVRTSISTPALCFIVFLCSASFLPAARSFDYAQALTKSLLYFEAQRSGRLPHHQRVAWRDHSGITDGLEQGVDLVGGYYDAGDHVKFGLPMAFTVTMLSWGVIQYGSSIAAAGELRHAMAAIKWGTDYFIKAHTAPNVLWAQVGDGDSDHYCWQRAEDMTTPRRAYRIDDRNPGSEIAGETAAAMAAAAVVFRETDPHYSRLLLAHARQVWELGERYRGRYDESVVAARGFYGSVSGYGDELLWGAAWLYVAGAGEEYLDFVLRHGHDLGGATWAMTEFSWDAKYAGLQVLAAKLLLEGRHRAEQIAVLEQYRSKAEHYLCACLGKNNRTAGNVRRSSAGLLYVRPWNNIQYVTSAAFLLALYSDVLRGSGGEDLRCPGGSVAPEGLLRFARSQVDYILGANPMNRSYLVGFGRRFPTRVHHRGASMPAHKGHRAFIGCTQGYDEWYGRAESNPNVLDGAVVGGPDWEDRFREVRGNYMQTEACTYNTAPLVGVLARLATPQPRPPSVASW